jgi:nucleoside-diphosphate-sugar epimerase
MLLRPFQIYGAGEAARRLGPMLIAKARAGERVELTAGEQRRDFLHVDDCASCMWTALAKASEAAGITTLNIGSGTAISLRQFIEAVADELRRHGFAPDLALGALPYRAGEPMASLPDTSRLAATLGWRPRISLAQGIADLVAAEFARCA